jgi:DNA-binding NarL/FixJ family response regulator
MTDNSALVSPTISVLLADSKPIESQLLAGALAQHGFEVRCAESSPESILQVLELRPVDLAMVSCCPAQNGESPDWNALRALHLVRPDTPIVAVLEGDDRDSVVQAFRHGARGIFCLAHSSFAMLCECIRRVHSGEISASTQHLNYLLDSVAQVPAVRVLGAAGHNLLTFREEQVVALVADGLSNRDVASELGLSEHTVKKYLFRIFDKLGISNRVELVLYAVHHGTAPQPVLAAGAS